MKKLSFWKADWFLGLLVAIVMLIAARGDLIQSLERKAYDLGVKAASRTPSDRIAIIAIDDVSIANIGRWPWSRDVHARMIDLLGGSKAKVIANTTFFFEPQRDAGLGYIEKLIALQQEVPPADPAKPGSSDEVLAKIGGVLAEAEQALNTDRKLASSIKQAGNVVLPMIFQQLTEPQGNPDKTLPAYVSANSLALAGAGDMLPPPGILPIYPIAEIGAAQPGIGHLNADHDVDGAVRAEPLLVRYYDRLFPSLSLQVAARSLNLGVADLKPVWGEALQVGKLRVRTDEELRMHTFFYADREGRPPFPVDSFFDVISGKVPAAKYQDKIVLIGATAAGLGTAQVTPVSPTWDFHSLLMRRVILSIIRATCLVYFSSDAMFSVLWQYSHPCSGATQVDSAPISLENSSTLRSFRTCTFSYSSLTFGRLGSGGSIGSASGMAFSATLAGMASGVYSRNWPVPR
jgi:serine/threonine-protein kinase